MAMATRHSPSAVTERPAPRANPGGVLPGEPFSLRAPRPMSWLGPELGKRPQSIPPPPPISSLPPPRRSSGSDGGPGSSPTIRIGPGPILPPRSRRVLWGVAAFMALAVVVLIANWRRSGRAARPGSPAANSEAACITPGSSPGNSSASTSVPAHMTACWGPAIEPPVISVYELPAVHGPPPPTRRYGFRAPVSPGPSRSALAAGAR